MSCNYAEGLSEYEDKGVLGVPEKFDSEDEVQEKSLLLAKWIGEASHVVVHTGAGISTSAGIPDFRGPNGVWTLEKAGKKPEINVSFNEAIPTKTHFALKHLVEKQYVHYIVSQNIDGLHLKTGLPRTYLAELHGNMFIGQCDTCDSQFVRTTATSTVGQKYLGEYCKRDVRGRSCRGQLKDTILDWEAGLPENDLEMADYQSSLADINICLGTTLQIVPSGNLPLRCKKFGGKLVIVNLQPTKHDKKADLIINTYVDTVLEKLMKHLYLEIPEYSRSLDPTKNQLPISVVWWNISKEQLKKYKKLYETKQKEYREKKKIEPKFNGPKRKVKIKKDEMKDGDSLIIDLTDEIEPKRNRINEECQIDKLEDTKQLERIGNTIIRRVSNCVDLTLTDTDDEFVE
ncbi:unnamed protein product [Ceutorhynchus assimilis]|uniref:protein acetyllysine N-acetyltransferase n=1 Tax=Ceutorhynchus assimilis TaxID=467358 RepID=A0A9N9MXC2_9CUCU|nr:unnamed protein product [Ceutorhynchus assimilis]